MGTPTSTTDFTLAASVKATALTCISGYST